MVKYLKIWTNLPRSTLRLHAKARNLRRSGVRGQDRVVPVATIESRGLNTGEVDTGEAANIDVDLIRIGSRNIERVNATMAAENVFRRSRVELIGRKRFFATKQRELFGRYDEVKETLLGTDGAITFDNVSKVA
jgi:hypothetical protein